MKNKLFHLTLAQASLTASLLISFSNFSRATALGYGTTRSLPGVEMGALIRNWFQKDWTPAAAKVILTRGEFELQRERLQKMGYRFNDDSQKAHAYFCNASPVSHAKKKGVITVDLCNFEYRLRSYPKYFERTEQILSGNRAVTLILHGTLEIKSDPSSKEEKYEVNGISGVEIEWDASLDIEQGGKSSTGGE